MKEITITAIITCLIICIATAGCETSTGYSESRETVIWVVDDDTSSWNWQRIRLSVDTVPVVQEDGTLLFVFESIEGVKIVEARFEKGTWVRFWKGNE